MSKALNALSSQLSWQLNDLNHHLLAIEQDLEALEQDYQTSQNKIIKASEIPLAILPEQEMARLHYMLHEQQQQDALNARKTALNSEYATLQAKQLRLKTELKRLQHYQERQENIMKQEIQLRQYQQADEWSLLHREQA